MRPPRRDESQIQAEKVTIPFAHAALTDALTIKGYLVPAGRQLVIERVTYYNATGLVADNANTFRCEVKNSNGGAVACLVFNTDGNDDPVGADLAAGWTKPTLHATPANLWFDADESVDVVFTEEGDATLPAGNGVIEARLY